MEGAEMFDVTAGRSAGTPENPLRDPTRPEPGEPPEPALEDVTAGRSAGTAWNTLQDPTRAAIPDDPRK
jgi:hypothetical protein